MNPDSNRALIFELADALLKSWWTLVGGICFGLAAAMLVLSQIPKEYRATAKILVTPQSIPKEFVRTTVTEDMTQRLLVLEEAVLSDRYMRKLIERAYDTPSTESDLRSLINDIRGRVTVEPTAVTPTTILAFDLTFQDTDRHRAALVVNTLAELCIEQNTEFRSNQAQDTTRTIAEDVDKARREYDAADKELTEFKSDHRFETEDYLEPNLRRLELAQRNLENNLANQRAIPERVDVLESQLKDIESKASTEARIAQLEQELDGLLLRYSEVHPDVVKKQRQIEEARQGLEADQFPGQGEEGESPAPVEDPQRTALRAGINGLKRELADLKTAETVLRRDIRDYERRIDAVPLVQPKLTALQMKRNNLHKRYQNLEEELARARRSQDVEESDRGQRFELAARARAPKRPVVPKPAPAYALGLVGGCLLFVGPLLIRRFLNPLVSSESGLRALTDVPVLVSIPRILTPAYRGATSRRFMKNMSLSAVFVASLIAVILTVD